MRNSAVFLLAFSAAFLSASSAWSQDGGDGDGGSCPTNDDLVFAHCSAGVAGTEVDIAYGGAARSLTDAQSK